VLTRIQPLYSDVTLRVSNGRVKYFPSFNARHPTLLQQSHPLGATALLLFSEQRADPAVHQNGTITVRHLILASVSRSACTKRLPAPHAPARHSAVSRQRTYSRLKDGEAFIVELVTPFVLESEYPNAHDQNVLWWWKEDRRDLREREEKVLEQREVYTLQTVDHGQVVAYDGDCPVETAKSGILRVGSHSKYGFGELRVQPVNPRSKQHRNSEQKTNPTG